MNYRYTDSALHSMARDQTKFTDSELKKATDRIGRRLKRVKIGKRDEARIRSIGRKAARAATEREKESIIARGMAEFLRDKILRPVAQEMARAVAEKATTQVIFHAGFHSGGSV